MTQIKKIPINQKRIRTIPSEGFSWIDRRFVRDGFIKFLRREAVFLYLFLVTVSDAHGLSFYADSTVRKLLKLDEQELVQARTCLIDEGLILYRSPLYQVLPLPEKKTPRHRQRAIHSTPLHEEELMSYHKFLERINARKTDRKEKT